MPRPRPHLRRRILVIAATAGLVLAGCSDDDDAAADDPPVEVADESTTTSPGDAPDETTDAPDEADEADEAETLEVTMVDFAFSGLPEEVPAGTRLTVANEAESELHELVAFRLPDDEERPLDELVQMPPGELEALLGQPVTVLLAAPGGEMIPAVGDGTLAEPGRYAITCFIPTGVEPSVYMEAAQQSQEGPPEIEGAGPPHVVHGMYAELTVS